jgi:hypothetical protein
MSVPWQTTVQPKVEGSLDREEGVLYNGLRLSGTSE